MKKFEQNGEQVVVDVQGKYRVRLDKYESSWRNVWFATNGKTRHYDFGAEGEGDFPRNYVMCDGEWHEVVRNGETFVPYFNGKQCGNITITD